MGACTGTSSSQVEVRAEEPAVASTTTEAPPDCAELLPPGAQAGQLLMVMVTSPQLATDTLTEGLAGGFGLKGRQSADVAEEIAAAVADAPVAPFVAGDEEGGTVQRLGAAIEDLPSAADLAEGTPSEAGTLFAQYAADMAALGINMNFGPVADVGSGSDLGSRSFGDDPSIVASFTDAIISAQEGAGIASIVKHWPGIGGGDSDPHLTLDDLAPIEELRASDLVPFERAIDAGASGIMIAHAVVPGLTGVEEPASLSRAAITDELRGRQGFDGLVVTDSLGMGAIVDTTPQDEAAEAAILAGADVALLSGTDVAAAAHTRLTEAIIEERIPTEQIVASVRRVLEAKNVTGDCVDIAATYSSRLEMAREGSGDDGTGTTDGNDTSDADRTGPADAGINDTSGSSAGSSGSGSGASGSAGSDGGSSDGSGTGGSSSSGSGG
jgi:beta-N-acetylhexosaminidase